MCFVDSPQERAIFFGLRRLTLTPNHIAEILEGILPEFGAFLVSVNLNRGPHRLTVQVFADTDEGIKISQCAEISRKLAAVIEEQNLIESAYELEVSSPGIDKPLKLLRQYHKNIGRMFRMTVGSAGQTRQVEGTLEAIDGETLVLRTGKETTIAVPFTDIVESKEVLPW